MGAARVPIAIAHDYLTQRGGAEKVVLAMARAFPGAPIYTTLYNAAGTFPEFQDLDVRPSSLNRIAALRRDHRKALPFLASASSRIRVDADVMLASSSGWAHGFGASGAKVVYCHNPARWLYQADEYLGESASALARAALNALSPRLRRWDRHAARSADRYLANSTIVRDRIAQTYGIEAQVLPAPHTIGTGEPVESIDALVADGFDSRLLLVVARLLPYKNVDRIVEAVRELPDQRLVVVGAGPERARIASLLPSNARIVSNISDGQLRWLYSRSVLLIAASREDYGLTPIEASSFGVPTVALRWGGFLDTVEEGQTGLFFDELSPEAIAERIREALVREWDHGLIRASAERFSERRFAEQLRSVVAEVAARAA